LKISAVKTVFNFKFPDAMSLGEINGTKPSFSAA
jgi:hypothetical protein